MKKVFCYRCVFYREGMLAGCDECNNSSNIKKEITYNSIYKRHINSPQALNAKNNCPYYRNGDFSRYLPFIIIVLLLLFGLLTVGMGR